MVAFVEDQSHSMLEEIDLLPEPDTQKPPLALAVTASALALAACGGGGSTGGGGATGGTGPVTPPVTILRPENDAEAARFLNRAVFASTPATISTLRTQGYAAFLDAEIAKPVEQTLVNRMKAAGADAETNINSEGIFDRAIWRDLMTAPDQLRKRVVLALSEMLVVGIGGLNVQWRSFALAGYFDVLNKNAFGNFRTLLEEATLNYAMGVWLGTNNNQRENTATGRVPDENYSREVMQLFTIGLDELNSDGTVKKDAAGNPIPTYTLNDVSNLARVFTGWVRDTTGVSQFPSGAFMADAAVKPMTFVASRHSPLEKRFLNVVIPANTDGPTSMRLALDGLFNHANVGPFFSRQMIQRLVTSNPSPAYVGRVAAVFNNNGSGTRGDLAAVVKAILMDSEALSASNISNISWGKLREPMIRFLQWARTFNVNATQAGIGTGFDTSAVATRLGQSPGRAGSVFNFFRPGFVPPNTAFVDNALVAPEFQIVNESSIAGYANFMQGVIRTGFGNPADYIPNYAAETALATDPAGLVDRIDLLMTARQLSATSLTEIQRAVESIALSTPPTDAQRLNRVYTAIMLTMVAPEYLAQK